MMNATAQRKKAATLAPAPTLPGLQQVIALALAQAEEYLVSLDRIRRADENWDEDDIDVDKAAELSLHHIRRMQSMTLNTYMEFDTEWFVAASAINLAEKAFTRTNCFYARQLTATGELFRVMSDAVEFADLPPLP